VLRIAPHRYECTKCKARVLVAFSDETPTVDVDDGRSAHSRIVRVANVEVHRCQVRRTGGT